MKYLGLILRSVAALALATVSGACAPNGSSSTVAAVPVATHKLHSLRGHQSLVVDVAFTPDGTHLLSCDQGGSLFYWDLAGEKAVWSLPQVASHCERLAISHGGTFAAVAGANDTLLLVNLAQGQVRRLTTGSQIDETAVAFSPDDTALVTGASDTFLRVWDLASGHGTPISNQDWPILDASFVTDDRFILAGDPQTIRLWGVETGAEVRRLVDASQASGADSFWFSRLNFSADGKFVIAGSGNDVVVFDLATGLVKQRLRGQTQDVVAVRLFPGNQRAISAGRDQAAIIWDVESGQPIAGGTGADFGAVSAIGIDGPGGQFAMADASFNLLSGVFGPTLTVWSISAPLP